MLQPILFYSGDTKDLIKEGEVSTEEQKKKEGNEVMYKCDTKSGMKKEAKINEQQNKLCSKHLSPLRVWDAPASPVSSLDHGYPQTPSLTCSSSS
jgi:hypothetical protein